MEPKDHPNFDDLPQVEGFPQGCAWGIFDRAGKKDVYGTLNFLTPRVVQAAAAEVKDGISISLKHVVQQRLLLAESHITDKTQLASKCNQIPPYWSASDRPQRPNSVRSGHAVPRL